MTAADGPIGAQPAGVVAGARPAGRPPDLRLALPALAAWASVAALTGTGRLALAMGGAGAAAALVLALRRRRLAAATGCCAAAAAVVCGLHHLADHAGPLPELAARRAAISADVRVTGDPAAHTGRVVGSRRTDGVVVIPAEVRRIRAGALSAAVRTPVLLLARGDRWSALLPGTGVRVTGRVQPASGGRAVALVDVRGPPQVTAAPGPVQRVAGRLRAGLRQACARLPAGPRGLLPGLVLGDTSRMPDPLVADFRTTGLTHLVAVSGANVAVILLVALWAGRRLRLGPRATPLVGLAAVAGFVVLARPSPSVLRAAVMGGVAVVGMVTGRRAVGVPVLSAAVLGLLLVQPALGRSPGFALSVLATAALLTVAPRWRSRLRRRWPGWLADAVAVPAAAQLVCAPVVASIAGSVSLVAVPANLLAAPAVAPATVLGVAATLATPVLRPLGRLLASLGGWPAAWIVGVAERCARLPAANVGWWSGAAGGLSLAAVTVAGLVVVTRRRGRRLAGLAAVTGVLVYAAARVVGPAWPPPGWVLIACDVGQGDGLLLSAGPGSAVVVDAGPDPAPMDRCLRRAGIRSVPLVVLSHLHADHVEGLPGVLRGRSVAAVEVGPLPEPAEEHDRVGRWAAAAGVPVLAASLGEVRRVGPLTLTVIGPPVLLHGTDSDPNNDSLVLLVDSGGLRLLLTGDVEPPAQDALLGAGRSLRADVLKVPHHGSAHQSPEFLAATGAAVAVVSVGADNPYGHPSAATLRRLADDGMTVTRTDRDGSVAVVSRGGHVGVVTERSAGGDGAPPPAARPPPADVRRRAAPPGALAGTGLRASSGAR